SLANELTGDRPWLGELRLVAVYARALTEQEIGRNFAAGLKPPVDYAAVLPPPAQRQVDFVKDVQPIFRERCFECHAKGTEEGGLNLGVRQRALEGGDHGPVLIPGDSANSRLIHLVAQIHKDKAMPPDGKPLNAEDVGLLRAWIDQGANWPDGADVLDPRAEQAKSHWAFQPLRAVAEPTVVDAKWAKTPVDRFILARLESAGLHSQAQADLRELIRRVAFDLLGLPPSPEEVHQFTAAAERDRDAAYDALVERLLASRHYGERWSRHWLDVARYADSDGQESDRDRPQAYRYRDFVIRVFNDDIPFDQFVRWQLAGDEYEPQNPEAVAATGFLTAGPFADLPENLMQDERMRERYNELDDMLSTIGTSFLGLTLGCARCHDHKYDAIPSRDYYRLMCALNSGRRGEVAVGPSNEKTFVYRDVGPEPQPTWFFKRGNYHDHEQPVQLGFVSILTKSKSPAAYWNAAREQSPAKASTNQRRALAEWMTDVDEGAGALLARVIVNRVWQHHFGQGLVRTVSDFGVRADPPTHPELLEWLAHDLVQNGWQIKRLQKRIVCSAVYQQASHTAVAPAIDPENRLLWRMPLTRLEAEILRDAMLAVSGTLNRAMYGPAVKPPIAEEAMLARNLKDPYPKDIKDSSNVRRRSVYLFHKRVVPNPLLQAFDKPDAQQSCGRRDNTTVAPQALALLNDRFVRQLAVDFADRVLKEAGADPSACIGCGYQLALARSPSESEFAAAREFVETQQLERKKRVPKASPEE
ncbi:MAG: PSD1 and planctomycete cytochrome C domain-containing protein, partial [Pirellulales bacterium]